MCIRDSSRIGRETKDGLGYSGSELEGMLIAGNTFDYPFFGLPTEVEDCDIIYHE